MAGPSGTSKLVGFTFNGHALAGHEGEPIAAALWAAGIKLIGHNARGGGPRGLYCGIGHCYECRATVNGVPETRLCITPLADGMVVSTAPEPGPQETR